MSDCAGSVVWPASAQSVNFCRALYTSFPAAAVAVVVAGCLLSVLSSAAEAKKYTRTLAMFVHKRDCLQLNLVCSSM